MTTVFTNGCFDLLHVGHLRLLWFARSQGDRLVVGLNSDESVRRLKGPTRPITPVDERREMLLALKPVDQVIIFHEDTPLNLIEAIRPDVLVKGPDYAGRECCGATLVESYGGLVVIPVWPLQHSSTQLVDRIANGEVAQ